MGKTFQVHGVHRWTTLNSGRDYEEDQHMTLINPFVKSSRRKLVIARILYKKIVIKLCLDYCQYSRVCNNGKRIVIELLWIVLSVIFAYFHLKYG